MRVAEGRRQAISTMFQVAKPELSSGPEVSQERMSPPRTRNMTWPMPSEVRL